MLYFKILEDNDMSDNRPIGIFDSGLGGISVLKEIVKLMPAENYIYFGDSANAPYGTKPVSEIRKLSMARAEYLMERDVKAIVVACNTATSAAINDLRKKYKEIPVIGIEPALKPAIEGKDNPVVIVMATPSTIREEKFRSLLNKYKDRGVIYPLPCPGLADLVETGDLESEALYKYLLELLRPYMHERIDSVVLGCTHYPFVRNLIRKILGDGPEIIDGSYGTAMQLRRKLLETDGLTDRTGKGTVCFESSNQNKIPMCRILFGDGA